LARDVLNTVPEWLLAISFVGVVAALAIGAFLLVRRLHRASVDLALVVVVSVIVASGFLTALILQYPYSGSIAVTSDPLTKGPLSHLSQGT
jgi:uncharacterized membrane protein